MRKDWGSWLVIPFLLLFMVACSSGGGSSDATTTDATTDTTITGTAAAGAAIVGTVNIKGANGEISRSAINADGSYTVDVAALAAPFLVWVEGIANGQTVRLYSTVQAAGEVANVTPATNMVVAMALGEDPALVYGGVGDGDVTDAAFPDAAAIVAAAADVNTLLASVFASLDMPADFDLMNGEFVADGSDFDAILDTVSFQVDSTDPANVVVAIADTSSGTVIYEENTSTDTVLAELSPAEVEDLVSAGLTFQQQALAIAKKIETLYATSVPTLAQLQAELGPFVASDYLEEGLTGADMLAAWVDPSDDEGPVVGMTFDSIGIYRAMKDDYSYNGQTLSEMAGRPAGTVANWCKMTITENGLTESFLTSFVLDADGVVRWYGNRNPLMHGADVSGGTHVRQVAVDGTATMWSGLEFWAEDVGNVARNTYGIDAVVSLHPGLPDMAAVGLPGLNGILTVADPTTTQYSINLTADGSVWPVHWSHMYTEDDGLVVANFKAGDEIVYVGADSATGTAQRVWINILNDVPLAATSLTAGHFPVITAPTSMSDITDPAAITVSWTMPTAVTTVADWAYINISDGANWLWMDADNPEWGQAWTSTIFDLSASPITSPSYGSVGVEAETLNQGRYFRTEKQLL